MSKLKCKLLAEIDRQQKAVLREAREVRRETSVEAAAMALRRFRRAKALANEAQEELGAWLFAMKLTERK